jgi:hypothetical protein
MTITKLFVFDLHFNCLTLKKMSYSELSSLVILFFLELIVLLTFRGEMRPNKFHGSAPILKIRLFYDKKKLLVTQSWIVSWLTSPLGQKEIEMGPRFFIELGSFIILWNALLVLVCQIIQSIFCWKIVRQAYERRFYFLTLFPSGHC